MRTLACAILLSSLVVAIVIPMAGCSTLSGTTYSFRDIPPLQLKKADDAAAATLTAESALQQTPEIDMLALSPEVTDYTDHYLDRSMRREQRARLLHQVLRSPAFLGIEYDRLSSYTANDAYKYRQANCLGFANLYIALARHYDIPAQFRMVENYPEWTHRGDMLVMNIHINTVVYLNSEYQLIVDINVDESARKRRSTLLRDEQAVAHLYNNLATEEMAQGDYRAAYGLLVTAIAHDGDSAMLWSNLGALLRANEQFQDAETAYQVAIDINPRFDSALNNLAVLYHDTGRLSEYEKLLGYVEKVRDNNPYYHYGRAQYASANKDWFQARRHLEKALAIKPDEEQFRELMNVIRRHLEPEFSQVDTIPARSD